MIGSKRRDRRFTRSLRFLLCILAPRRICFLSRSRRKSLWFQKRSTCSTYFFRERSRVNHNQSRAIRKKRVNPGKSTPLIRQISGKNPVNVRQLTDKAPILTDKDPAKRRHRSDESSITQPKRFDAYQFGSDSFLTAWADAGAIESDEATFFSD
jgi:hypothetical protein